MIRPFPKRAPKGIYTDMDLFVFKMTKAKWLDVFSYSFGQIPPRLAVRRLILSKGLYPKRPMELPSSVEVRLIYGTHTKLWIGSFNKTIRAYLGSFNLGMPTIQNVMVESPETAFWLSYYEHFWKQGAHLS